MTTRAQVVVSAGRFRDNRPAMVTIECDGDDGFEIVLRQVGHKDAPPTITRLVMFGEHAAQFVQDLAEAREHGAALSDARRADYAALQATWERVVSA